ncbi:HAD-IA family hydrolase [Nisaea sediminum]|uniref:hypothetical protein n=1 Tax=Nisaea sediminum TaxID=2775867 RepID=UPI001D003E2E|nr:hypothetical protein [Nisaea sediminum]
MDGHGKIGGKRAEPVVAGPPPYLDALGTSAGLRSFYASSEDRAALLDAVAERVTGHRIALLSIDIFDTALLRGQRSELARFRSAAERFHRTVFGTGGKSDFSIDDALLARITAARAAYSMNGSKSEGGDPTFSQIAKTVCTLLRRPELTRSYIESELASEIADVQVNPLLEAIRRRFPALRTVFLTDTYLESPQVRKIFSAAHGKTRRPAILSSADGFGSKAAGTLFAHAERTFGAPPAHALHIGDNLETDYLSPKRRGWQALHVPLPARELAARRTSFEKIIRGDRDLPAAFRRDVAFVP